MKQNRVVFYTKTDLSSTPNLRLAETLLNKINTDYANDINNLLEIFQIKKYFDNDIFLLEWNQEKKAKYRKVIDEILRKMPEIFVNLNKNIFQTLNHVEFHYLRSYWELISLYSIHKTLKGENFERVSSSDNFYIKHLLYHKSLVDHLSTEIRKYLLQNTKSAEILLTFYEMNNNEEKIYFPSKLSPEDKEIIIVNYINNPDANLNFVRLVVKSRDIKLSNKTKLKAMKVLELLEKNTFSKENALHQCIEISTSNNQTKAVEIHIENNKKIYTYSTVFLDKHSDYLHIFSLFSSLFYYINNQGCIDLVTKSNKIDTLESILMHSKNEYLITFAFSDREIISHMQMVLSYNYFRAKNIHLEMVLSDVVNSFIDKYYEIGGLRIQFPSVDSPVIEKIRMLAPELEFILKQYQSYTDEGFINFELLNFSSEPLFFSKIKSKIKEKYVYGRGSTFNRLRHLFFGPSFSLYINKENEKYKNFYELLESENLLYDDFENYQKKELDYLINSHYLSIDENGYLKKNNAKAIYVLKVLHDEDVINFWHYSSAIRDEIKNLHEQEIVIFENTLFTREEMRYFNYYLNKKEFTNSLDLRNKYLHGTNSYVEKDQEDDYYKLLKLAILIIFKINNDLNINLYIKENNLN